MAGESFRVCFIWMSKPGEAGVAVGRAGTGLCVMGDSRSSLSPHSPGAGAGWRRIHLPFRGQGCGPVAAGAGHVGRPSSFTRPVGSVPQQLSEWSPQVASGEA